MHHSAQVFELWGDTPIFPGPSWRLAWPLLPSEQDHIAGVLQSGGLWTTLQESFPELAGLADPWQAQGHNQADLSDVGLQVIAALARALLQPAELETCTAFMPVQLNPACLVLRSDQHELAGVALRLAAQIIHVAWVLERGDRVKLDSLQAALPDLRAKVRICCDHRLTAAQLAEARRRGIPTYLIDPSQRLYQLGTGIHSRWISSTSNDHDSALGVAIAADKSRTADLLRLMGLPVPAEIRLPAKVSNQDLIAAAKRIGYPCVLKPQDGEQGRGVTANIRSDSELLVAATKAKAATQKRLLLQKHVIGDDYRLSVINGDLPYLVRRNPPAIRGDGSSTVVQLIEEQNSIRRTMLAKGLIAAEIKVDDAEVLANLAKADLKPTDVPKPGQRIQLRGSSNISTGGLREDLDPRIVHPLLRQQCLAIASTLRLEICGIDYISHDITSDPSQSGGAFVEVNSMPQSNTDRAERLLNNLFPNKHEHTVKSRVVVCDLKATEPLDRLNTLLTEWLEADGHTTIGVFAEEQKSIVPALWENIQSCVCVYQHPRELLVDRTNSHIIFLASADLILHRGLPDANCQQLMVHAPWHALQPAAAWERLILSRATS